MRRIFCAPVLMIMLPLAVLAVASVPVTISAQGAVTWNGSYYDNGYLLGSPVLTQQVSTLAFNWGGGSPSTSVPADNFSARFASDVFFRTGTYRFYILADDGVKLWIDYPPDRRPVLDTYDAPRPGELLIVDVALTEGTHHLQIDYHENTGVAYLYLDWENLVGPPHGPDFPVPVVFSVQWAAQYFNNPSLAGIPVLSQSEADPSHNWGTSSPGLGVPADYWSARWTVLQALDAGTYTATISADDGVRLIADATLLINEWHSASGQTYTATFPLTAGQHSLAIEFYEATGTASLEFTLTRSTEPPPTPTPTGPYVTVTAYYLNVRTAPVTGVAIMQIQRDEQYPLVGRTADSRWWQINVDGTLGWVSGVYVNAVGGDQVPVTGFYATPVPSGYATRVPTITPVGGSAALQCPGFLPSRLTPGGWGRVTPGLPNNVRSYPSLGAPLAGQIPAGGIFQVINGPACTGNTAWWQVSYYGIVGWTMEGEGGLYWLEPYRP
jgi:uncharacterized protein YraI